ncbi:MAG: hypothetical protein U5R49_15410 [Deltaproteobacteria bacterium]|nr:hypothetical protein [Deltaproteobacteria bacterium]
MKSVRRILWVLVGIVAFGVTGWAASETGPRTVSGFANETIDEHMLIDQYDGPATCVACHEEEAREMFGSVHYQWSGSTPNVPDISGPAGKGDRGFNTYCGTVVSSRRISCWGCHVGNGKAPSTQATAEQLNNIDCMMCHQPLYERKARGPFETLTYTGFDGVSRSWELPVEDAEGNFQFEPDLVKMGIDILTAARTVGKPTRAACLRCHAYAAGSDCGKRGDLSEASADAPADADVHLAPLGADLTCQSCHRSEDHRVLGRGLDLRPNDRPERLTCMTIGCHEDPPHDSSRINRHTARVACQSCHIPEYATLATTEMARVWETPVYYSGLLGGQGGFKPEEIREGNVLPTYRWYNGTSRVYALGQVAQAGTTGAYELGLPYGGVDSLTAQIHPMKEHVSTSGLHDATGQLIPQSTFTYFVTGDFDRAVQDGMTFAGLSGEWQTVDVHTYQTINHGVEPSENALGCGACHTDFSDGDPVCMDLKGDLGYQLKGPTAQICIQCHEFESAARIRKNPP